MKKIMFAIKDTKTEFIDPFISTNQEFTIVEIGRALKDDKIPHYVDKELWKIGDFDSKTGQVMQKDGLPELVCTLSILKQKLESDEKRR